MGHGGAGSPSIKGSAGGMGKFAKDKISSGVGNVSTFSVFCFVVVEDSGVAVVTG